MKRLFGSLALLLLIGATADEPIDDSAEAAAGDELNPDVSEVAVQKGDTLWDITERVVGDPFLWPKIWAFNPEISNPHWIYPGDIIRFYEPDLDLPSAAEMISGSMPMPQDDQSDEADGSDDPQTDESMAERPSDIETIQASRRPKRRNRHLVNLFVTAKELQEAGRLTNAAPDKILLDSGDEIYLTFEKKPQIKTGQRFLIYRTVREVTHPIEDEPVGFITQVTGVANARTIEKNDLVRALLDRIYIEVERGQYVTPIEDNLEVVVKKRLAKIPIEGYVLAVGTGQTVGGQDGYVFVDKGTNDGIERGNRLKVYSRGDPVMERVEEMPYYKIGELHVLEAKETASTCLVINSRREIEAGNKFRAVVR